jgi:prepilin peptidase CpaA
MGGGDVKLLTAAAVFVFPWQVFSLLIFTSLAGGVLAICYLITGFVTPRPAVTKPSGLLRRVIRCELWRLRRRGPLPYASAIAAAGVVVTFLS